MELVETEFYKVAEGILTKVYLLNCKDNDNVARSFHLKTFKQHEDEATCTDIMVKEPENAFLLYKTQGSE